MPGLRAVIFDLDEALLDTRRAWRYTLEEALVSVTGRRIDAGPLLEEYRRRPLRDALGIVLDDPADRDRCEQLARTMFERSAMKQLLVHEGIGMALDELRGARVEMGAISRRPHTLAIKQIHSTGTDRFLAVLSPTPPGERWDAAARVEECVRYLEHPRGAVAFVSGDVFDLRTVARANVAGFTAGWVAERETGFPVVPEARSLLRVLGAAFR